MRLSDFIRARTERIAKEWEDFARTCEPAASKLNVEQLRDHILPLLRFLADDMDSTQTPAEQHDKAYGNREPSGTDDTEGEVHGGLRVIDGFTVDQVVGEFRALRASILRLWIAEDAADVAAHPEQIIRFNEAIDQLMTESVARHADLHAQAYEQSKRRDAFLATLAHELRGPLSAIANTVHLIQSFAATNADLAPMGALMSRQTQHLKRLLNDLLDLARIARDRISLEISLTDIRECVQDAIEANREAIAQKAHVLKVEVPPTPVVAEVDSTRIVQVTSNLVNNAAKYASEGSRIEVALSEDDAHAVIRVKDDGGFDPQLLPVIFDAFSANHHDDLGKTGLGIGLWLTRRLIELHAGTIEAFTEGPGRGAEFRARIPLRLAVSRH